MAKKKVKTETFKEEYFPFVVELYFQDEIIYFSKYKEKEKFLNGFQYMKFFENKNYNCKIQVEDEKYEGEYTSKLVQEIIAQ